MAAHADHHPTVPDRLDLGPRARSLFTGAVAVGVIGLVASLILGYLSGQGIRRFYFAYLISFCFFLSIALGGLFFVLIQHLTRAGWSVSVRRVAEAVAATLPVLGLLSVPIIVSVMQQTGQLYPWALPLSSHHAADAHAAPHANSAAEEAKSLHPPAGGGHAKGLDELTLAKRAYLNPAFFVIRLVVCFGVWSLLALWYWKQSAAQDTSGDVTLTSKMQAASAPALVAFGITVTVAAFDLLMSLDPHWYSTIFGVYFFAGAAVALFASLIAILMVLQKVGFLRQSISAEHYHDLGKYLFGFVFFWGYIAFSQYMLIWYAAIPEETAWLARRGMTTVSADISAWTVVSLMLLFGHLLIPFAGLLSRHVKRNRTVLLFWATWLLVFHWIDLYWLAMPELDGGLRLGLPEVAALVGVGGIFLAALVRNLGQYSLRPLHDPRLEESLAFENI